MELTPALVERITARLFPAESRAAAAAVLARYGTASHEREPLRVRVAALKLSQGSLERLQSLIESACRDYRDVLAWAESPVELRSPTWRMPEADSARIRAGDKQQYLEWLQQFE